MGINESEKGKSEKQNLNRSVITLKEDLLVSDIYARKDFELIQKNDVKDFDRKICRPSILRPQLALTGFFENFYEDTIVVFGQTELRYLNSLKRDKKIKIISKIVEYRIPCVITTCNNIFPEYLLHIFQERNIPVFTSSLPTVELTYKLLDFLDDHFAQRATVHGSLVEIYGLGVLIIGEPGTGKSELTLDLIERGHRMVSDDVVIVKKRWENRIFGASPPASQFVLEIRALGMMDVMRLFGLQAVKLETQIDLVVKLIFYDNIAWSQKDRVGRAEHPCYILDVEIPLVELPILVGKNLAVATEAIVLMELSKKYPYKRIPDILKTPSLPESTSRPNK